MSSTMFGLPVRYIVLSLLLLGVGCGDDQAPREASVLYARISAANYRSFRRAPGFETKVPSRAAHGDGVIVYLNDVAGGAVDSADATTQWPDGTLIVKDGFDGDDLCLIAVMEKRDGSWFWAEYDEDGTTLFSGEPDLCVGCHSLGDDFVRSVYLP